MPWKAVTTMSQKSEFVHLAQLEGANLSQLCRQFGVSRRTGYKWLQRAREGTLEERSRRPHHSPGQTPPELEARVLAVREQHPAWGGRKIAAWLERAGYLGVPSPSTITQILHRAAQINPQESAKHRAFQRFEMARPNQLWQMDFKGYFGLGAGRYCHPLTVLDDHSRFLVGLRACPNETTQTVQTQLTAIFRRFGLPEGMLMDNGSPWGDDRDTPYTILGAWLLRLGIGIHHGHPFHPQTQGKDERLHRTLQAEVIARQSWEQLADWQTAFDVWEQVYNFERPHEALGLQVPASRYQPSCRPFPEVLPPIAYPSTDLVRKVNEHGKISFHNRDIRVGKAFRYAPVGVRATEEEGRWEVYFCAQRVAQIDLRVDNC
jgi:transposase InsO family protein